MGRTCGGPNENELTAVAVTLNGPPPRSEFVHGRLNQREDRPCDMFESTEHTHGSNGHDGLRCGGSDGGVPVNWGVHDDDGQHGFTVCARSETLRCGLWPKSCTSLRPA